VTPPWRRRDRSSPYVIAEIGVNHDGAVGRAMELVDAAAGAAADAVKLQFFETDRLMSRAARLAAYQADAGEDDPFRMLRRLELSIDEMAAIVERAHEAGLHAVVTVFSLELVESADALPWDAYKIASPDVVNRPLLEALAATGRPLIVSTGAASMDEVLRARAWLEGASDRLSFLHCVSAYPTPMECASLGGITAMRAALDVPVGYSDHTHEVETGALAVAVGAEILEKHLTWDRTAPGPDHAASLEPDLFDEYTRLARDAAGALETDREALWRSCELPDDNPAYGTPEKAPLLIEQDVRTASRQSLVATRDLSPGAALGRGDITIKRPGTGLAPWRMDEALGRALGRAVQADMPIREEDLA